MNCFKPGPGKSRFRRLWICSCALPLLAGMACAFKYAPLPFDSPVRIEKGAEIEVNLTGEVGGMVFKIDRETIQQAILAELREIFPLTGTEMKVTADVYISYKWEITPFFLLWPFVPLGAPSGKHVGEAEIALRITNGQSVVYKGTARVEKMQGLYYNWQYDPPFKGGVLRFALREAMSAVKKKLPGNRGTTENGNAGTKGN